MSAEPVTARRLRWFGPLLASRISGNVFTNQTGVVEVVTRKTCQPHECDYLTEAIGWIYGFEAECPGRHTGTACRVRKDVGRLIQHSKCPDARVLSIQLPVSQERRPV